MIRPAALGAIVCAVTAALCAPAASQDQETALRAQAEMLRKTIEKRDQEIARLKERIAELEREVRRLEKELAAARGGSAATQPAEGGPAQPAGEPQPTSEEDAGPVAASQPSDADYHGLARLLHAIPPSRMPGEATPKTRDEFSKWARAEFGGDLIFIAYQLKEIGTEDDGKRLLLGQAPMAARKMDRKVFFTVATEVSAEQLAGRSLKPGDRVKVIGRMPETLPVEPVNAKINDVQATRLYGRVVSRRKIEVNIKGWSEDYAALLVRVERARLLD